MCHSAAANDLHVSASFSLDKILNVFQRIRLRFFRALRPRICRHLLFLATKDYSDRLLALRRSQILRENDAWLGCREATSLSEALTIAMPYRRTVKDLGAEYHGAVHLILLI
jgi:hypothetical protein